MKKIAIKRKKFLGSKEHQKFVKREKTKTFLVHFFRIFLLIAIIGLWELVAFKNWVEEWNHLYNPKTIEKIKKTYELANSGIIARLYPKK